MWGAVKEYVPKIMDDLTDKDFLKGLPKMIAAFFKSFWDELKRIFTPKSGKDWKTSPFGEVLLEYVQAQKECCGHWLQALHILHNDLNDARHIAIDVRFKGDGTMSKVCHWLADEGAKAFQALLDVAFKISDAIFEDVGGASGDINANASSGLKDPNSGSVTYIDTSKEIKLATLENGRKVLEQDTEQPVNAAADSKSVSQAMNRCIVA